jgi:hypothetical protein
LAHVNSDATRAAYARSELIDTRRELMSGWAKFCETGRAGDIVGDVGVWFQDTYFLELRTGRTMQN